MNIIWYPHCLKLQDKASRNTSEDAANSTTDRAIPQVIPNRISTSRPAPEPFCIRSLNGGYTKVRTHRHPAGVDTVVLCRSQNILCLLLAAHLFNTRPRSTLRVGKFGRDPPVYSTRVANSKTVSGANNNNTILLRSSTLGAGVGAEVGWYTNFHKSTAVAQLLNCWSWTSAWCGVFPWSIPGEYQAAQPSAGIRKAKPSVQINPRWPRLDRRRLGCGSCGRHVRVSSTYTEENPLRFDSVLLKIKML